MLILEILEVQVAFGGSLHVRRHDLHEAPSVALYDNHANRSIWYRSRRRWNDANPTRCRIVAEDPGGKVKATKDTDRKPIVLARVRHHLTTGRRYGHGRRDNVRRALGRP